MLNGEFGTNFASINKNQSILNIWTVTIIITWDFGHVSMTKWVDFGASEHSTICPKIGVQFNNEVNQRGESKILSRTPIECCTVF